MVTLLDEQESDVLSMQKQMLAQQRGGKKEDTRIYWKRPMLAPDGKPDPAPGWIIWASDDMKSTAFSDQWMSLGRTPLPKYGHVSKYGDPGSVIELINQGKLPENCPDKYGPWGRILSHPDGPAEFPVDQVLAYRWYDPERCPVPGVVFPQLRGVEIEEYDCPECNNVLYAKPVHLARHLRNTHNYDRQEIVTLGHELGINFGKELVRGGRVKRVFTLDEQEFAKEAEKAPTNNASPVVTKFQPSGRAAKGSPEAKLRMAKARAARDLKKADAA